MSAKVYKFPGVGKNRPLMNKNRTYESDKKYTKLNTSYIQNLLYVIWIVLATCWFFVKWLMALDVLYQFLRAIYYSGTPGMFAGWYALFHFGVFIAITYFVEFYGPRKF